MHSTPARRRNRRLFTIGLVLAALTSGVLAVGAAADQISNNLDTTADAVAEVMPLTQGGANGTTHLYVVTENGDGKNGCNLTGSTTATISLASSDASVATVSPSSVTFTSCVTSTTGPVVTVTPVAVGTATVSASLTSNTTAGTFNVSPVTFTVNVSAPVPTNTPPHVSVSGVTGGASYAKGSVPAASCNVTDAEDGNSSFAATLSAVSGPDAADGIGQQTASCSYTDGGGLTATDSVTYSIVDQSAPSIGYTLDPSAPDGDNGWYRSDVSLTWSVTENESPSSLLKTGCVDQNITADQDEMTYSCSASSAGGSASQVDVKIKRDATVASVNCGSADGNWHAIDVSIGCTASDAKSGLADSADASFVLSTNVADGTETANASTGSRTVYDTAGNSASAGPIAGNKVDKKAPDISDDGTTGLPTGNDGTNDWYNHAVIVNFSAVDGGSGLAATCLSSWTTSTIGEGTGVTAASGACADAVANTNPGITSTGYNVDVTKPSVAVTGVSNGAQYTLGSVPAAGCSTSDSLSGVKTNASLALIGGTVGSVTASCSGAEDYAGNSNAASVTYTVVYSWHGFFQPVDNPQTFNVVKSGQGVPVKFDLGGDRGLSIFATGYPKSMPVNCDSSSSSDALESTVTAGGSSLNYDPTVNPPLGQYIYVWKTDKAWAGTCRRLDVKLNDSTIHSAYFHFTR